MKNMKDFRVKITFEFDYTDMVNDLIDSEQVDSMLELKDFVWDCIPDDVEEVVHDDGIEGYNVEFIVE